MPFQSIPDCAELVIRGTVDVKPVANVIGFHLPGGYNQTNIDDLATAGDAQVTAGYKPIMTAGMSYIGCDVRGLTSSVDLVATDASGAGAGGIGGAQLNNNVTLCITLRSGFSGRSARGRFYAFPTGAGELSAANLFVNTYGDALVAFLQDLQVAALAVGWHMAILSRRNLGALRPVGVSFDVTNIAYRNLISDSQRGRLPTGH